MYVTELAGWCLPPLTDFMTQQSKKDLRRDMRVVLSNLDERWLSRAHAEVCAQLTRLLQTLRRQGGAHRHVFAWIPCFAGEVDLAGVIGPLLKDSSVYIPRLDQTGEMSFVRIGEDWGNNLVKGPRGVVQPADGYGDPFTASSEGDEIIVLLPGLAFNTSGCRLGRGAGHYDRFLSKPEFSTAVTIGVCWSMQVVQDIPVDPHDVRVDWIAHERGIIQVNR